MMRLIRKIKWLVIGAVILSLGSCGEEIASQTSTLTDGKYSVTGLAESIRYTISELSFDKEAEVEEKDTDVYFKYADLPEYSGQPYITVNGGNTYFTEEDYAETSFESYSELDGLGRCQTAFACLSKDTMPLEGEERGEIGMIKPTGWYTIKYGCIEDLYLYNRCHLIGWQLGAENANELNLVTGTRYMNLAMTEHENLVAEYIRKTGNHVLYRVTPVFIDDELVCRGLLIEGESVEDDTINFCVFYYNVQPGIEIDYKTGESAYNGVFLDRDGESVIAE